MSDSYQSATPFRPQRRGREEAHFVDQETPENLDVSLPDTWAREILLTYVMPDNR